jgi:hypothetical protein
VKAAATLAAVAAAVVTSAYASVLPPSSFRLPWYPRALAAAGPRVAVAATDCTILVSAIAANSKRVAVRAPKQCRDEESDVALWDLWLGRAALAVTTIDAPSPHGESYALWIGPLPRGPLRRQGDDWGWTDSSVPHTFGCAWSIVSGGGVIAFAQVPNRLGPYEPACPAGPSSKIILRGAAPAGLTVAGSWSILATDGKRLALARIDRVGRETGELALVDLHGKRLAAPKVASAVVKNAFRGWLAPEGLILETGRGVSGPGWTVRGVRAATVAEGRLLYLKGRTVRVRRLRGGADRALLKLPTSQALLAAGSFGLAIATGTDESSTVFRVPWRTIDRTLPRR